MFIASRSMAKDSPAGGASAAVPVIWCRAGSGSSAVTRTSSGAARLTERPMLTSAAAARISAGVM
jgi:hypothetical protein